MGEQAIRDLATWHPEHPVCSAIHKILPQEKGSYNLPILQPALNFQRGKSGAGPVKRLSSPAI